MRTPPRRSSRSTRGQTPNRYGRSLQRAGAEVDVFSLQMDSTDATEPTTESTSDAEHSGELDVTVVPTHVSVANLVLDQPTQQQGAVPVSAGSSRRSSITSYDHSEQIENLRTILSLNKRVIELQREVDESRKARIEDEKLRSEQIREAVRAEMRSLRSVSPPPHASASSVQPKRDVMSTAGTPTIPLAIDAIASTSTPNDGDINAFRQSTTAEIHSVPMWARSQQQQLSDVNTSESIPVMQPYATTSGGSASTAYDQPANPATQSHTVLRGLDQIVSPHNPFMPNVANALQSHPHAHASHPRSVDTMPHQRATVDGWQPMHMTYAPLSEHGVVSQREAAINVSHAVSHETRYYTPQSTESVVLPPASRYLCQSGVPVSTPQQTIAAHVSLPLGGASQNLIGAHSSHQPNASRAPQPPHAGTSQHSFAAYGTHHLPGYASQHHAQDPTVANGVRPQVGSHAAPPDGNPFSSHYAAAATTTQRLSNAHVPQSHQPYEPVPPIAAYIPQAMPHAQSNQLMYQLPNAYAPYGHRRLHDLPSFSGRPEDWPLFQSSYIHTTAAYGYSQLENQTRLLKSLSGDARRSVECLLIQPQHVDTAMRRLEAQYGRPDQLVRSQIRQARDLPSITESRITDLIPFAATVQNCASFLDTPATQHHLYDATLLEELVKKLPMGRRIAWAEEARRVGLPSNIGAFACWLTNVADLIASVAYEIDVASNSSPATGRKRHVLLSVNKDDASESNPKCSYCRDHHDLSKCYDFARLSVDDRWTAIRKMTVCFGCLGADHFLPACEQKRRCGMDGCDRYHHRKLHRKQSSDMDTNAEQRAPRPSVSSSGFSGQRGKGRLHRSKEAEDGQLCTTTAPMLKSTQPETTVVTPDNNAMRTTVLNLSRDNRREATLFFRVVPVTIHANGRQVATHALLDEGSSITLIDEALADDLRLDGPTSKLNVQWFSANASVEDSRTVSLTISGQQPDGRRFDLRNVRTVKNLSLPVQTIEMAKLSSFWPHLRDIPVSDYRNAAPQLLIGLDNHHLGVPSEMRTSMDDCGLVAAKTPLGWVVYGSDSATPPTLPAVLHVHAPDDGYELLDQLVRSHFSTETFGVKVPQSVMESDTMRRAREIMQQTTRRVAGRFETGLLWRSPNTRLPPSYDMALRRLRSVEARMRRDSEYARLYKNQIAAFVEKGYARRLDEAEARHRCNRTWFLPHFGVFNANKPGKLRLVFDAAATVGDVSLNSELLSGPDVNVALVKLLMQFRVGAVGIVADIREMFLQVKVREADQVAQRFLWRNGDDSVEPDVYTMAVMTFGATCSPALAQHVKNVNASEFAADYPAAAEAIRSRHYVDDYVASFDTAEEAATITSDVVNIHRMGGFELRGFTSNSRVALEQIGRETGSGTDEEDSGDNETGSGDVDGSTISLQLEAEANEKVLGMCWNTVTDTFQFRTKFARVQPDVLNGQRTPTKREILSVAMSVFDPYGLLADFMLESKLILQDLWRIGLDWDTPVPERFADRWHAWRKEVECTKLMQIPRCYSRFISTSPDVQLHIYADASEVAFAAVAYWRVAHAEGVDVAFILGRTRCAPLKILTVPRLELQAAVLATRLLTEVRDSHPNISLQRIVFWSDSATVLSWLRSDQRKYKPFVQFRVAEILEAAPVSCWRWVPTTMNVADDATRVRQPPSFRPDGRWTRGPAWLRLPEAEWPVASHELESVDDDANEIRSKFVGTVRAKKTIFDYQRFSSFRRLCRVAALVQRYIANLRSKTSTRVTGPPDAKETELAMLALCRMVQEEVYAKEIAALIREDTIDPSSEIYTLKAYLESDGLLRMYGRTDAADEEHLPFDSQRPILLPRRHQFTRLLAQHHHEQMAHQLTNATIAAIRQRFWIPQLRVLVNSVQSQCFVCKRRNAQPIPPVQGQLPVDRLTPYVRPFTSTGLDYFGPVFVTVGRRREKRWVAVFTCLAVRAVHLEIAADLSTDACLLCVRNLCHVRGTPSRIRCDNGTNFVGARNLLETEEGFLDAATMQRELCAEGIQWVFNCPGNPEAGGIWERMVQGVKRILAVTLREEAPRVETLRAHLLEAANMLNSRPLTHVPVSVDDVEALTPNHFLIGGPNAATMTDPTSAEPKWIRKQWRISRELSRRFWGQWVREYLPELTHRTTNHPERKLLSVDDIVVVCEPNQPRGRWPLGRIVSVSVGTDGRARTAEVRTKDGTHRRPVARLAVLEVEPASE